MTDGSLEGRGPGQGTLEAPAGRPRAEPPWRATCVLPHVVSAAMLVYMTVFSAIFFSSRSAAPETVAEGGRAVPRKIEERQAGDTRLLTTNVPVGPATLILQIPLDRAMELLAAESRQTSPATAPAPIAVATTPTPKPGPVPVPPTAAAAPKPAATAAVPTSPPAKGGMSPVQLYHAACIACHNADGRGTIVRKAMPLIPDFTDPKWQASRTDADLSHSMLDGKGQLMLPMKAKFELAHTDVKEMLALVRGFQPRHQAVAGGPKLATPATATAPARATKAPKPAATKAPKPAATAPKPETMTAKLRASAKLFRTNCIACHGPDGRGAEVRAVMPPIPDFTTREFQSSHTLAQISQGILQGKGALMPPWRDDLSLEQARDLAAYIRTFGPADLLTTETPENEFRTRYQVLKKQWDDLEIRARALSSP